MGTKDAGAYLSYLEWSTEGLDCVQRLEKDGVKLAAEITFTNASLRESRRMFAKLLRQ